MPAGWTMGWLAGRMTGAQSSIVALAAFVVGSLIGLALLPKALDAVDAFEAWRNRK